MTGTDRAIEKLETAFWDYENLSEDISFIIWLNKRIPFEMVHKAVELKKAHRKATRTLIRLRSLQRIRRA